jgi:leucyl/phenylalanyl-tRNA--protein transferase
VTHWSSRPEPPGECPWYFPPPSAWPDDDLIAAGADLQPATLVAAYRAGLFPMGLHPRNKLIGWWSPDPRGILPLDRLHVTHSMKQSARKYHARVDTCFEAVVRGCGNPSRPNGWITSDIVDAYRELHERGWAHSVEVFDGDGQLAGGLYGVRINGLFAGESMFHVKRDASKVALMHLVRLMRDTGMTLLDVQWRTDFLASLGAIAVKRETYLDLLEVALQCAIP